MTTRRLRIFGASSVRLAGALSVAACLSVFIGGCSSESPVPPPDARKGRVPQQLIHGMELHEVSVKGLLWILEASEGRSFGPDEPTELTDLKIRFYDGSNQIRSTLRSKHGQVDSKTQSLLARDSVVVVTPQGERLETESLKWDPKQERISTDDPFRFTRGTDILTGVGFEADPDLTHYVVHGQVRAEVRSQRDTMLLEELDADSTRRSER